MRSIILTFFLCASAACAANLPELKMPAQHSEFNSQHYRELVYHVQELERKVSGMQGEINKLHAITGR